MGVVIRLSFLLLLVVFRSALVPIKAAVLNLLSIADAYGVIVAVVQWGWLSELIGVDRTGPTQSFAPTLLFAILLRTYIDIAVSVTHLAQARGVHGHRLTQPPSSVPPH